VLRVREEVAKAVVGQERVVTGLVVALLVRGHVLLEGVPGVAKTLLVKALAASLDLDFKRVQFTPDLMPSDVLGQLIYERQQFRFRPGPVFTNLLLADEVNRTPPKTQAALLEAMEERQVSVEGEPHPLPEPFLASSRARSEEDTSELQSRENLVCRLLLEKKNTTAQSPSLARPARALTTHRSRQIRIRRRSRPQTWYESASRSPRPSAPSPTPCCRARSPS